MTTHPKVLDLALYRLRRLQQQNGNAALFDQVARMQRLRQMNAEIMRRAIALAASKASKANKGDQP